MLHLKAKLKSMVIKLSLFHMYSISNLLTEKFC